MDIDKSCKLFLKDVFLYDISACHYTIIKRLNYNISNIPDGKFERNKYIGILMRENPRLTSALRSITESVIDEYIAVNNVKDDELILRQYDGIITTRPLYKTDLSIPIDFRNSLRYLIISSHRKWYVAVDANEEVLIKGIPHRYEEMDDIYKRLLNMNYLSNSDIFKNLQKIKDEVLSSEDASLYCIPVDGDKCNVFLKEYGEVGISKGMIRILDTSDIDRQRYFDFYIRPFTESICIEFL